MPFLQTLDTQIVTGKISRFNGIFLCPSARIFLELSDMFVDLERYERRVFL